jgi:hypothetical protein
MRILPIAARCLAVVLLPCAPPTQSRADELRYIETRDLRIVSWDPSVTYLVPYATQCFLNSLAAQHTRFGYTPDGKVTVLLEDFSDRGSARLSSSPRNRLYFDIAPTTLTFETFSPGERLFTVANHEGVHFVTGDQASPEDERYRRLFGGKVVPIAEHPESLLYYYLTAPRNTAPRWYHEGSAVFMETWQGGGYGRAQGGYDEMVFRAMVRDGAHFYDPLGLVSKGTEVDFQVGANAYLYGTRFMSYLALEYGPEKLIDWWRRDAGSRRSYSDDFRRVYGKELNEAWQDWVRFEHEFQAKNLAAVREHPVTPHRDVTATGLGALSRVLVSDDRQTLYAAVRYPGRVPHLVAISLEDGSVKELAEVNGAVQYRVTSLALDPEAGTLFYTTDNLTYRNLLAYDLKTGKSKMLLERQRIGELAFNRADRSLWGLRTNNGFAILVRIPYPYTEWERVHVFSYGEVPFDLDVSPDGSLLSTSMAGLDSSRAGAQVMQVRIMKTEALLAGDATPMRTLEFGSSVPESFVFSADGRYLYGSSYYTGVSNIYRYEITTAETEAVSNAETGFFRPVPISDDQLLVFNYTAGGFVPALIRPQPTEDLSAITFLGERIATQHPVVQGWSAGSPSRFDYESNIERQGTYRSARELSLESIFPIVEGYKDSIGAGVHARFSDPIGFSTVHVTGSYRPDSELSSKERAGAALRFEHEYWQAGANWNAGDFYDIFGPTKRSREGYNAFVAYDRPILYRPPETVRVNWKLAAYGDLDALPNFQNIPSPSDKLYTGEVGIEHRNVRSSIANVDDETGFIWGALAHAYGADGDVVPGLVGRFDVGFALPARHSSIWWRNALGGSTGDRDDPLANFFFGGFGNNYVDDGDAKRYREVLSMPGFEIDAIGGRTFAKSMLEWNLPPLRFESVGTPGFYVPWARSALFATALSTDFEDGTVRDTVYNVGLQIDFEMHVMHRLPMMLSFGYAAGFADGDRDDDEFMISLKVL